VCDHLVVLVGSRVEASGDLGDLLAAHRRSHGEGASLDDLVLAHLERGLHRGTEARS
jgi:hypothetical protein